MSFIHAFGNRTINSISFFYTFCSTFLITCVQIRHPTAIKFAKKYAFASVFTYILVKKVGKYASLSKSVLLHKLGRGDVIIMMSLF